MFLNGLSAALHSDATAKSKTVIEVVTVYITSNHLTTLAAKQVSITLSSPMTSRQYQSTGVHCVCEMVMNTVLASMLTNKSAISKMPGTDVPILRKTANSDV